MICADTCLCDVPRKSRDGVDEFILAVDAHKFCVLLDYMGCWCISLHCQWLLDLFTSTIRRKLVAH